jgi:hypothetical protein
LDLALNEDDDNQPSSRPHIPNWICVKENCQDGGLTDLTATLHTLTPEKNAETIDLHTLHTLHTQSLRNTKISHDMNGDCIEENPLLNESGSKVCKARLTPTFEPVDDGCKVSKVCKADDKATPAQPPSSETAAGLANEMREAIAKGSRSDAGEVMERVAVSDPQVRAFFAKAFSKEENISIRLLEQCGLVRGTQVKYVGNIEQYEGEVLTVDDINAQNELACLRPDGKGYTTWLKPSDLRKL